MFHTQHLSRSEKWERALTPQQETLFVGIEEIDWFNLEEDHSASEIPNYLRLLLADDEDIREEARYELERTLWNYETHEIYSATPLVVPFLLNLLKDDEPPGKNEILYLLSTFVGGHSILADMATSPQSRKKMEELLKEKGKDFKVCLQNNLACIEATKRAVGDGIPIYFEFLVNEEDLEFKEDCLYILSRLSNKAAQIVPRLQRMLLNEENAKIRAHIVRTLYDLMDDGPEAQHFFVNLIRHGENEGITFIAAGALTKRAREKTPESAVEILLNASQKLGPLPLYDLEPTPAHDEIRERYSPIWLPEELCFVQGYYSTTGLPIGLDFAMYVLKYLGKKRGITTFQKLLPTMQNPLNALRATEMMLDLAFNNEPKMPIFCSAHYPDLDRHYQSADAHPPRNSSSLTNDQRAVLVALVAHDPLWEVSHNLLELYGLPISRDELQLFLTN